MNLSPAPDVAHAFWLRVLLPARILLFVWPTLVMLQLLSQSSRSYLPTLHLHLAAAGLLAAGALGYRMLRGGPESKGWALLMAGQIAGTTLAFLTVVVPDAALLSQPVRVALGLVDLIAGTAPALGLMLWPWPHGPRGAMGLRILASLLFGASLLEMSWLLGIWQVGSQGTTFVHLRLLVLSLRVVLVGGTALFLLADRPSRLQGPLGWVLGSVAGTGTIVLFLLTYLRETNAFLGPWFTVALFTPLCMLQAALSPQAPDPAPSLEPPSTPWVPLLPFLPFVGSTLLLGWMKLQGPPVPPGPILGYLALVLLTVLRTVLQTRELDRVRRSLEARVEERTRQLAAYQALMLRMERLNAMALLRAGLTLDQHRLMTSVDTAAEAILADLDSGRPLEPADLERIRQAAQRASVLSRSAMKLRDSVQAPGESVNLATALQAVAPRLQQVLDPLGRLHLQIPALPGRIALSPDHLEQILVNLAAHARADMATGGLLEVELQARGEEQVLTLHHDGAPLDAETRDHIFDPAFTPKGKSLGLGLPAARLLVEQSGGWIEVASAPGMGTTFTLSWAHLS